MKKTLLFLLLIIFSGFMYSQEKNSLEMKLDHVALSVKNVDSSAQFYQKVLHLQEITNRTQVKGIRWFSLGDGKELHLISTLPGQIKINKAVHLAFTTPEFDVFIDSLKINKINYSDWSGKPKKIALRADGIRQIYLQDPDGYWIEVNSVAAE